VLHLQHVPDGVPHVQLELGLPQLYDGLRAVGLGLRDVFVPHQRLRELLVGRGVHGLREQLQRGGQRQLRVLQQRAQLVSDLQLEFAVPQLLGRLRDQRQHVQQLQLADRGVRQLQFFDGLHCLRQLHLHSREWHLPFVQQPHCRLPHLQLCQCLHQLRQWLRPKWLNLYVVWVCDDRLLDLQLALGLHRLHQQHLRARQRELQPMHGGHGWLCDLQLRLDLPQLQRGLHSERGDLRDLQQSAHGLHFLQFGLDLHRLHEQLVHVGQRQLHFVQLSAAQLSDLQFQLGLPFVLGGLLAQRRLVRRLRHFPARLLQLQLQHNLPGLHQQHLYFGEQQLHSLQFAADGLFDV
jgi:hypothetical protein